MGVLRIGKRLFSLLMFSTRRINFLTKCHQLFHACSGSGLALAGLRFLGRGRRRTKFPQTRPASLFIGNEREQNSYAGEGVGRDWRDHRRLGFGFVAHAVASLLVWFSRAFAQSDRTFLTRLEIGRRSASATCWTTSRTSG